MDGYLFAGAPPVHILPEALHMGGSWEGNVFGQMPIANDTGLIQRTYDFLKNIPAPIQTTTTDSDGRFECKIPQPGEYVLQTAIRSAKTGALRLWFVSFDSRDPLNTPVDITESNVVRQFNPIFMVVEGR